MGRSLVILLGALTAGAALFGGSFFLSQRVCMMCEAPPNNLAWLRKEFHLNNTEVARIKKLHERYLVQCDEMCRMIADKKKEVSATLTGSTNVSLATEKKLGELAACRAQCQSQMLHYFMAVSQVMPPAEGRRYLAEMQNLTLGLQKENQHKMTEPVGHEPPQH